MMNIVVEKGEELQYSRKPFIEDQQQRQKGQKKNTDDMIEPRNSLSAEMTESNKVQIGEHNYSHVQQDQKEQRPKRKHRRGKPKCKNGNKPYKKANWRYQGARLNNSLNNGACSSGTGRRRRYSGGRVNNKILRTRPLVPYNTNKFLMEEHLAEIPSAVVTANGRTRDSSFSMDSEDNYFFSLPEDEEEFLTKEFANVYERARVERLETLNKQELIYECLQIEDRYSKEQANLCHLQRLMQEYVTKIRALEDRLKEYIRENYELRSQLMRTTIVPAVASPPSASIPPDTAWQPAPMDSSSEDSESDSSSSSSSSSTTTSGVNMAPAALPAAPCDDMLRCPRNSSSPNSSNVNHVHSVDSNSDVVAQASVHCRMECNNDYDADIDKSLPSPIDASLPSISSAHFIALPSKQQQQDQLLNVEHNRNVHLDSGGGGAVDSNYDKNDNIDGIVDCTLVNN